MIEEQPRPGSIGLTSIDGPVGWGIRLGQALNGNGFSQYEHAFLVLDGGELIEAQPGGAVIRPLAEYDGRHVLYVAPELTDAERHRICVQGRLLAGTPYSGLDYLALAAHRFHLPLPGLRAYVASSGHLICSQLVDEAYLSAGMHLFADGRWPGYVVPAAIYQLLGREEAQR